MLYLANIEAPIAPRNSAAVINIWLPLYVVRCGCQICTFRQISLASQWNSQMAWAGYSFSTLASIFKAFCSKWKNGIHTWFKTRASRGNYCFILQYSNTIIAAGFYLMMTYRAIVFIFQDQGCNGWMSIGALIYGFAMLLHVHSWSLQPLKDTLKKAKESTEADPSLSGRRRSPHSLALQKFN